MYRGRDVRVDRIVRLKVFGEDISLHKEALERIHLEAKALSLVSHPHLCRMYDFCEKRGYLFFVLEYVEGEALQARLLRGPFSADDRLSIASELSEAVAAVHGHGLLLGDLNTSNVVLTKFGVKLVNFALPESVHHQGQRETRGSGEEAGDALRYVAPEVLKGCAADPRSDIFSLGSVLLELLASEPMTGPNRRAFLPDRGRTGSVLSHPSLRHLLDMCLLTDPEKRWQSAADVAMQLRWARAEQSGVSEASKKRARKSRLAFAALLLGGLAIAVGSRYAFERRALEGSEGPRFKLSLPIAVGPRAAQGVANCAQYFALSPDGKWIAMNATIGGNAGIWLKSVENDELRMLDRASGMHRPFWSPDSSWVGFDSGQGLRIAKVDGTTQPESVGDGLGNATWTKGDTILLAGDEGGTLVKFLREGEGWKRSILKLAVPSGTISYPTFTPDGNAFLFVLRTPDKGGAVYAARLGTDKTTQLLERVTSYALSGNHWILYSRDRQLFARDFDFRSLRLGASEIKVADNSSSFSSTTTGPIVYAPARTGKDVEWEVYDRAGHRDVWPVDSDVEPPYSLVDVSASPDGKSFAVVKSSLALGHEIWVYSASRGMRQITHGRESSPPVWRPDGKTIAYSAPGPAAFQDLYEVNASGEGEPTLLYRSETDKYPLAWSQDRKSLLFESDIPPVHHKPEIWVLQLGTAIATPVVAGGDAATQARVSPDNRWLLYSSGEHGSNVYVRAFGPGAFEPYLVSLHGGEQPSWGSDGKRIYYVSPTGALMETDFDGASAKPRLGAVRVAFPNVTVIHRNVVGEDANRYVLFDRDSHLLVEQTIANAPLPRALTVLVNWLP
jgi:Tol biopolymer transport system component